MKKIGLLYICTGPYCVFWEKFYKSSEQYFLKDFEKHYFVFSDKDVDHYDGEERVHYIHIDNLPWPLITLLRYHFFMSIADQLDKMDYLLFSNSNMEFKETIRAEEMLPLEHEGQKIFVVAHPGYYNRPSYQAPFERRKISTAYVPYNYKGKYVIGAMNGGTAEGFLKMSEEIMKNTNEDLKKNVIARWHDESQINHYIYEHKNFRLLTPTYCYPFGFEMELEGKIVAVSKQAKFDVKTFKGAVKKRSFMQKVVNYVILHSEPVRNWICMLRDTVFMKK